MESDEITVMVVWPSVARFSLGSRLGELYAAEAGFYIFTVGNLAALGSIPLALGLYFLRLGTGVHYKLTNRRVLEQRFGDVIGAIPLDGFDSIEVDRQAGQHWYDAGDLVFRRQGQEVFRLRAVSRPEAFRRTCWKSHQSFLGVRQALSREAVPA